jgi:hypothetical protein
MMNYQSDILDETIRLLFLDEDNKLMSENLSFVLQGNYKTKMTISQKERMLMKLKQRTVPTFGQLLAQAVTNMNTTLAILAEKAKLPLDLLESLIADLVFANKVPVVLMKSLLRSLHLSFDVVQPSMLKSFQQLKEGKTNLESGFSFSPSYRKGTQGQTSSLTKGSSDVFENEEAMTKYLTRLKELM